MKNTTNENLNQLIEDVRKSVEMLKEYGMSEKDILSILFGNQPLPQLIITRSHRLFLGEQRKEVHMEPLVKAVYMLFLKHPEGIVFKKLSDYKTELTKIYSEIRPWGLTDRALRSIEDVTNPSLNSINEKCARIRRVFLNLLGSSSADYYCIMGKRGEAKRIALPRELVVWETV